MYKTLLAKLVTKLCVYNLGSAPITNGMATVTINGLECGVTYTIIAGGTLNETLIGPRSTHGNIFQCCLEEGGG